MQQGKEKKKEKGKENTSKGSEYNSKKMDVVKEKKYISCWLCAKEHYVNNYPFN
jgi:hypothetical protein